MCSICHSLLIHPFSTSKAMLTTLSHCHLLVTLHFSFNFVLVLGFQEEAELILFFFQSTVFSLKLFNYLFRIDSFPEVELLCQRASFHFMAFRRDGQNALQESGTNLYSNKWDMKVTASLYADKHYLVLLLLTFANPLEGGKIPHFAFLKEYQLFLYIYWLLLL